MHGSAPPRRAIRVGELPGVVRVWSTNRGGCRRRCARLAAPPVALDAALTIGTGCAAHAATAGSLASGPPGIAVVATRAPVARSPASKRDARSSRSVSMISKSAGNAPAATPTPTRPGNRAASHATSSATSATGRNGRSSGHGRRPPFVPSRRGTSPRLAAGSGGSPRKPPWCSLVITPSKPCAAAERGLRAQLADDRRARRDRDADTGAATPSRASGALTTCASWSVARVLDELGKVDRRVRELLHVPRPRGTAA